MDYWSTFLHGFTDYQFSNPEVTSATAAPQRPLGHGNPPPPSCLGPCTLPMLTLSTFYLHIFIISHITLLLICFRSHSLISPSLLTNVSVSLSCSIFSLSLVSSLILSYSYFFFPPSAPRQLLCNHLIEDVIWKTDMGKDRLFPRKGFSCKTPPVCRAVVCELFTDTVQLHTQGFKWFLESGGSLTEIGGGDYSVYDISCQWSTSWSALPLA